MYDSCMPIDIFSPNSSNKISCVGFEHIHRHTHFSLLDGWAFVEEYAARSKKINQNYLCISDHGMMACVPTQIKACDEYGLSPIFACELYVNPLQPEAKNSTDSAEFFKNLSDSEKKTFKKSYHLLGVAYNNIGYSNLVKLSSWGWTKGYYYRPRVNYEMLMKHKEGIIFSSCCYMSEIGQAFETGGAEAAEKILVQYLVMFGHENFRLEIMLLDFKKQKPYDIFIIAMSQKYGLKLIVTNDCHYCEKQDSEMQRIMLMIQTGKTVQEINEAKLKAEAEGEIADLFELQDQNLWMKSEEELNEKWLSDYSDVIDYEVFKMAKLNTVEICEQAKGVSLDRSVKLPKYQNDDEVLKEAVIKGFAERKLPKTKEYLDRIQEEFSLIKQKEFCSYFLIQKKMTDEARRYCKTYMNSSFGTEAVGPGRGSAAGSLIAYCLGITDVNPIRHDLLFSRFLSPARGGKQMKLRFTIPESVA